MFPLGQRIHSFLPNGTQTVIDQAPNYGGPTALAFYVGGAVLVLGVATLWIVLNRRGRQ